ncbi:hypothetical protein PanWU01x14_235090 [Parasponia andersonii]|uniref:Uncharacterized protein n=1 Tax=Parasponia andersonii TaxID=3476 RepID=A0A2P5BJ67_PARAD|nr:hypothetical protein PanWU01x14_235090 [Parasponia andersonii]
MGLFSVATILAQDLNLDLGINGTSLAHTPSLRLDKGSRVTRVLKPPLRPTLPSSSLATSLIGVSCPSSSIENRTQAEQATIPPSASLPSMKSTPPPHVRMAHTSLVLSLVILYFDTKLQEGYWRPNE